MIRYVPFILLFAVSIVACTSQNDSNDSQEPEGPAHIELKHKFSTDRILVYESETKEFGAFETAIKMRYQQRVLGTRPSGQGEIEFQIKSYLYTTSSNASLPEDALVLNQKLAGATFLLLVSPDGHDVTHIKHQKVPEITQESLEALKYSLSSHFLRLPREKIEQGYRWSNETPSVGNTSVVTRNRWRALSIQYLNKRQVVELVCLSNMSHEPQKMGKSTVSGATEFHYSYVWNNTDGILESLISSGSLKTLESVEGQNTIGEGIKTFKGYLKLASTY